RISPETQVVFMTGHGGVHEAVRAVKGGAYDFLTKPFESVEAVSIACERALEYGRLRARAERLEKEVERRSGFESVIGSSPTLAKALSLARDVAASTSSVLLRGESGTGKEVFARAIHLASPRAKSAFVVVNCGALPEALVESELFGHVKGAFTGAIKDKRGLFEEAHGGTIFLDEIGEMPAQAQVRLLRVLQSGEVRRVGGNDARIVDVRVIAATNADLKAAIKEGRFREDLFYRLNVIGIELPPLRARVDDIPLLAMSFLRTLAAKAKKDLTGFTDAAMNALLMWSWPGNVRELENTIERAVVVAKGKEVDVTDLPESMFSAPAPAPGGGEPGEDTASSYKEARDKALAEFERGYVSALLRIAQGNMADAAKIAGLDRSNFRKVVVRSGVDFRDFLPKKPSA
ncbi:MAG TPA: sigma-54 dependent transcriptional regulator, partial [Candidatus Thermoplasmatota archaeon]|nr:sigma-54 dependent transcriptional regulator [Candidatus Thermoplasmatota archaeon]